MPQAKVTDSGPQHKILDQPAEGKATCLDFGLSTQTDHIWQMAQTLHLYHPAQEKATFLDFGLSTQTDHTCQMAQI